MSLQLHDLDERTRHLMRAELRHDLGGDRLYLPKRLLAAGRAAFPRLLDEAFASGSDATLAAALRHGSYLRQSEPYRGRDGCTLTRRVPWNAAEVIAEDAFNRYYARAVCIRALADGQRVVEVYRAKAVASPRPESQGKLSFLIQPERLLADLRVHLGDRPVLGVPAGPNSGVSVRIVRPVASGSAA